MGMLAMISHIQLSKGWRLSNIRQPFYLSLWMPREQGGEALLMVKRG